MTDVIENPVASPPEYLTSVQRGVLSALHEAKRGSLAEAYEATIKFIYLVRNPIPALGGNFISKSAATCIIGHLSREIVNTWRRTLSSGGNIKYHEIFNELEKMWEQNSFPLDGKVPPYKPERETDGIDVLFPRLPMEIICSSLQQHHERTKTRAEETVLLLRDIYGDRSEENPNLEETLKWLKNPAFERYAHLSDKIHTDQERDVFEEVVENFNRLEALLVDHVKLYYDREAELDEILSQANG